MYKNRQGIILLPLLFLLFVLTGIGTLMVCLVHEEITGQIKCLHYRQLQRLGIELIKTAEKKKLAATKGVITLPKVIFYPGRIEATPRLQIERDGARQIESLKVSLPCENATLHVQKLRLRVPGGAGHSVYQENKIRGWTAQGRLLPYLAAESFVRFATFLCPKTKSSWHKGLKGMLYIEQKGACRLPAHTQVRGNGVIFCQDDIFIERHVTATGKLWLFSKSNIYVGDNVQLTNALLISEKNVTLGYNTKVCGIIVGRGEVMLLDGAEVKSKPHVLDDFTTPIYVY